MSPRKLLALSLTAIICLMSIGGCTATSGGTQQSSAPQPTATQISSQQPESTASEEAEADPFGKYDPAIEMTTVRTNPNPLLKYADGDSMENNVWTRAYEEELGIKSKYLWTADTSQLDQKINLMITSGDLPDYFMVSGTVLQQLVDAGLIADITDPFQKFTSDGTKKIYNDAGPESIASATFGGKLMAVPFNGMPKEGAPMLWLRDDWLKNLNLSAPKSMDDVISIIEAFTQKDPDGNGKDDTIGLYAEKDLTSLLGFFNGYHAYPDLWIKDASGSLVNGSLQPEIKTALGKLQELYAKGCIIQDFGVRDSTKANESITSGKCGLVFGPFSLPPSPLQQSYDNDPKAEWQSYPLVSIDDKPAMAQFNVDTVGYWVVNKNCKTPEAMVKMLNLWDKYFYDNTDGEIAKKFVSDDTEQSKWKDALVQTYKPFSNADYTVQVTDALNGKMNPDSLAPNGKIVYDNITSYRTKNDAKNWWFDAVYGDKGSGWVYVNYKQNSLYLANLFYGPPTPTMIDKSESLKQLQTGEFAKIIVGSPLDDEFDKFISEWNSSGGQQITEEVNQWFAKKQ